MGDSIRCKFYCSSRKEVWSSWHDNGPGVPKGRKEYAYEFAAVTSGSEENKAFWAATPSGRFEVQTVLVNAFEPGKEYFFDISPAAVAPVA